MRLSTYFSSREKENREKESQGVTVFFLSACALKPLCRPCQKLNQKY